mmetsp:Transcript_13638/g.29555  ORF Transcript_13638/g.29555 Transcript_13638/m.29555 type:complete len:378 (+) Transcript_13638:45-1178(+)
MAPLVPLSWCFVALYACPADGLGAPRPSAIAHDGWAHSTTHHVREHNHSQPQQYKHMKRPLPLGLQNDDDGGADINNKYESALVEESNDDMQRQRQQSQQLGRKNSNSNNDPSPTRLMSLMGTSPRRIFLSLSSSTAIALAANFFGITSNLLSTLPEELAEKSGLDSIYPRGDYKRVTVIGSSTANSLGIAGNKCKCSFLIPKEWVADTGLALAQAQRQARALDYSMTSSGQQQKSLPDAAYGPPGRLDDRGLSNGDTNVSVIINTGVQNFSLLSLGSDPKSAAEFMLSSKFGPRRPTALVSAIEERRGDDNTPVYQFEYTVDRGERAKPLRAMSVVAGTPAGDAFVTITVVSPEEEWERSLVAERLRRVVESFKLL